jgi:hypothetical protein
MTAEKPPPIVGRNGLPIRWIHEWRNMIDGSWMLEFVMRNAGPPLSIEECVRLYGPMQLGGDTNG